MARLTTEEREARAQAKAEQEAARKKAAVAEARLLGRRKVALVKLGATNPDGRLVYGATTAAKLLGITPKVLATMLEPCDYAKNFHYKTGPQVGLYDPIELLRVSKQKRVAEARARCTPERKAAAQKAVETKRKALLEWVANLEVDFHMPPDMTLARLAELAIENRNEVSAHYPDGKARPGFEYASYRPGCETEDHVQRWMVNYLRRCATDYESILAQTAGKVGFQDVYAELKEKIALEASLYIDSLE